MNHVLMFDFAPFFFIAVDSESESASLEPKIGKEMIDYKEVKRVDHILASLQRKVTKCCFPVFVMCL